MWIQMDWEATVRILLERMVHDVSVKPTNLPISLLKSITNNFSDDQRIGSGGFAVVYKGLLQNGIVAVKKLSRSSEFDERKFNQEVDTMMRVKHKNIVRFLGYCADTQGKMSEYGGKHVMAEERQRLLCFEFLAKGSLDQYITDASQGLEWKIRYQIIKGICQGLHYLHKQSIVHLDLKPANILLTDFMLPKIADFGLSRCFGENKSRTMTSNLFGTPGYTAPEFFINGVITFKLDIYSLGVIILEILTGQKGYTAVENVLESWKGRIKMSSQGDVQLEQITACAEIGIQCIEPDLAKRPDTGHVIVMLEEMERAIGYTGTDLGGTLFENDSIHEGSSGSSTVGYHSMDNTQNDPATQQSRGTVYNLKLYMHQTISGSDHNNQVNIANLEHPQMFGCTNVHDYPIYNGLGPNAKVVARAQGLHTETNLDHEDWFHWSNIVFSDERFQGSSIIAIGNQNKIAGEWVIVGGTGVFALAQGTITICTTEHGGSSLNIKEICIRAFCCRGHTTTIETKSQATECKRVWYMHQIIDGPNRNQVTIADPQEPEMFGYTNVHDYPIYDSLGPGMKIVARAQGLHSKTSMNGGSWFHWSKIVFDYERFQGSSFNAIGNLEGEWAIVGGTGEFAFVEGTATTSRVKESGSSNIIEIRIHAFCYPPTTPVDETKPLKDKMIITGSNYAFSNVFNPMANNPQSGPATPLSLRIYTRILYMHQIISGPDYNQVNIADPRQHNAFACTNVHDYPIYDSLGPRKKLVARAQGLHTKTSMSFDNCWLHWSSVVFTDERFQGSSLKTMGNQEGDWAILGGTGMFTFAQGTVSTCRIQDNGFSNIKEIRIDALCCTPVNGVLP